HGVLFPDHAIMRLPVYAAYLLSPIQTLTVGFRFALNQPYRKTVRVAGLLQSLPPVGNSTLPRKNHSIQLKNSTLIISHIYEMSTQLFRPLPISRKALHAGGIQGP